MSAVTTYTCDKCGTCAVSPEGYFEMSIGVKQARGGYTAPVSKLTALWCRACVVAAGLTPPKLGESAPPSRTTLEDLVREIVEEGIDDRA